MKKLVAISVLLVSLTAAVFAQNDGKWKVGFMARLVTDMLSTTNMSGKSETSVTSTPTTTQEFGKFNKGTINFFGNKDNPWHSGPGQRLLLSLSNSGENYEVYADMKIDQWATKGDQTVMSLLEAGSADWWLKGNAGIFNAQIGTAGYGGFVSTQATWNDWIGWNQLCRFGVWRGNSYDDDFYASDEFRTWNQWGTVAALGATFADNYRVSLGYRINPYWSDWAPNNFDPTDSKSSINGSFMVNARVTDAIAVDLFYSVLGKDDDTFARPIDGLVPAAPAGKWENTIGAYVGLNIVENLGLSLGYTANFDAYENTGYLPAGESDPTKTKPRTYTAPFYSGIDLRVNYTGIDKIGLTFNNNFSFAGVKGEEIKADSSDKIILGFSGPLDKDRSQDWFHWNTELRATFALVENLGLTLHLGDQLGVNTYEDTTTGNTLKTKDTTNEFRVSLFADYGIGAVNVGIGLDFGVVSKALESERTFGSTTTTVKANSDVTYFGIPILFKVAF